MAPTPVLPSAEQSPNMNDLDSSSTSADQCRRSPQNVPKPRNRFTLPSSSRKISNIASPELKFEKDEDEKARKKVEDDLAEGVVSKSSYTLDNATTDNDLSMGSLRKNTSLHGSLENIYRPKNHRLGSTLNSQPKKTGRTSTSSNYSELKAAKAKSSRYLGKGDSRRNAERNDSWKLDSSESSVNINNETLLKALDSERKKIVMNKVVCAFLSSGLQRRKNTIVQMEDHITVKTQECAARLILHHLLLNSWRHVQHDVERLSNENLQLQKSSENLSLQLRVVRHLQNSDKEKILDKTHEINALKTDILKMSKEKVQYAAETEKIEGELNELQYKVELLNEEKYEIQKRMKSVAEKNEMLAQSLELEKKHSDQREGENFDLKRQANELKKQTRELTAQSTQWQERARSFESEVWELKMHLETRDKSIAQLQSSCNVLQKQNKEITTEKLQLESKLLKTKEKLENTVIEKRRVEEEIGEMVAQLETKAEVVSHLEKELQAKKQEHSSILKELYKFKLQNVRRRRVWGNTLYYVFSPIYAFRDLCSG